MTTIRLTTGDGQVQHLVNWDNVTLAYQSQLGKTFVEFNTTDGNAECCRYICPDQTLDQIEDKLYRAGEDG